LKSRRRNRATTLESGSAAPLPVGRRAAMDLASLPVAASLAAPRGSPDALAAGVRGLWSGASPACVGRGAPPACVARGAPPPCVGQEHHRRRRRLIQSRCHRNTKRGLCGSIPGCNP
jgi:hypothetical protein